MYRLSHEQGRDECYVKMHNLAEMSNLTYRYCQKVVRSLERRRLIEREVDAADTRARRLHVSKRGALLAARAIGVVEQVVADFFADIPQRQTLYCERTKNMITSGTITL